MDEKQNESVKELRTRVENLTRSLAAVNTRLASIDPGDGLGVKRKVLELDQRVAILERGESVAAMLAGRPYSD